MGYEWSGNPDSKMVHRNVLFRNAAVPPRPANYIEDRSGEQEFLQGYQQSIKFAGRAAKALGIEF